MPTLTQLNVYPVKGARGISVREAALSDRGLVHDRRFMVVDEGGHMCTQRDLPGLARVATAIEGDTLLLSCDGQSLRVPLRPTATEPRSVRVWRSTVDARDVGAAARAFLSSVLGRPTALVYMPDESRRAVNPAYARPDDLVSFADGYPYLLTSESSLAALNAELAVPVGMERFRANLVIAGTPAYAEDAFRALRVGEVTFDVAKPCDRCVVVNTDQESGAREKGPLEALVRTHLIDRRPIFGQNLLARGTGVLRVGDPVTILAPG